MRRIVPAAVLASACLFLALGGVPAAQPGKPSKAAPAKVKITAVDLARECEADAGKAEAKYKGKVLRVTGVVGSVYDEMLYLPASRPDKYTTDVVIRFAKADRPAVKTGERATFEGAFDRVAVLGPALTGCKLVKPDEDEKPKKADGKDKK